MRALMRASRCPSASRCPVLHVRSRAVLLVRAGAAPKDAAPEDEPERANVAKGKNFSGERRRRGRPAHLRSPDDSPLRDGNRDRLMGLLTERAAKTLAYYYTELNQNLHNWLNRFIKDHPIPRDGKWDDVSGDTFLRTLLSMPIEEAQPLGRDALFHNTSYSDVDPRSMAQRIMEIRAQLANEFVQDLKSVAEDNKLLQLETLAASLLSTEDAIADGSAAARQVATGGSGSGSPGGAAARREGGGIAAAEEAARARAKKAKKSVLPPQPTPSNWRLRLEVEAQVYGSDDGAAPTATAGPAAAAPAPPSGNIPEAIQTGLISMGWTSPSGVPSPPPPAPTNAPQPAGAGGGWPAAPSPSAPSSSSSPSAPAAPPLHPEVAELLPLIRASPAALTPDVASMLSSLAVLSNGRLHPDIADALRAAVAGGARLHPEMAELLRVDAPPAASPPAPAPGSGAGGGAATALGGIRSASPRGGATLPLAAAGGPAGGAPPALGQSAKLPVAPASSAGGAVAAAAAAAAHVAEVAQAQLSEPESEEEENSITALQNDSCLHSDDD